VICVLNFLFDVFTATLRSNSHKTFDGPRDPRRGIKRWPGLGLFPLAQSSIGRRATGPVFSLKLQLGGSAKKLQPDFTGMSGTYGIMPVPFFFHQMQGALTPLPLPCASTPLVTCDIPPTPPHPRCLRMGGGGCFVKGGGVPVFS